MILYLTIKDDEGSRKTDIMAKGKNGKYVPCTVIFTYRPQSFDVMVYTIVY